MRSSRRRFVSAAHDRSSSAVFRRGAAAQPDRPRGVCSRRGGTMRSPFAERESDRLIEAILPDVAFAGWARRAIRVAAQRTGIPVGEAEALFPRGASDMIAAVSRWADRQMLARLETATVEPVSLSRRVALALRLRFEVLLPWREAVRRSLSVLSMPQNVPLGLRLLYDT